VAFPGGLGTLDELCEVLTLSQTKKLDRPILVLLYGREYWSEVISFDALAKHGMISPKDLDLFRFVESPTEALSVLQDGLRTELHGTGPAFAKSTTAKNPEE
jgi:hypothetical protein